MSGPLLAAVVATVVAVVALAGVAVLVLQVRRLRADVTASEATRPDYALPAATDSLTEPARSASTAVDTGPADVPALLPAPDHGPAQVFELLPVQPADEGGEPPSQQQILAATLTHPLVRVSALSYGIRHALRAENRDRVVALVRRDLRRRHKVRRRAARRAARVVPIRPADDDREETAS